MEREIEKIDVGDFEQHASSGSEPGKRIHTRHQRQLVEATQTFSEHRGLNNMDVFLKQPPQAPVALHQALKLAIRLVGGLELAHDGEHALISGFIGRRLAARNRRQLALVEKIDVAAERELAHT